MENNEMINNVNEEAMDAVYEVANSSNNAALKVVAGVLVLAAAGVGVVLYRRKKKNSKTETIVVESENVEVKDSNEDSK